MSWATWSAVVAHSHGGYIALKAASARPELVKKMALVESSGFLTPEELSVLRDTSLFILYGDNLDAIAEKICWRRLS
jgi:pimeloyl-ACP methyl ester carboxylesterase